MVAEKKADDSPEIITNGDEPTNRGETGLMNEEQKMTAEAQEENMNAEEQEVETTVAENTPEETEKVTVAEETEPEEKETEQDPEDEKEEETTVAENQDISTSQVLEHSLDTHESVENWGDRPVHVIEYHERIIETMEEAGTVIAELENQIAELNEIKTKYDAIVAERAAAELAEKQAKARSFAEKQGLDVTVAEVKEAIEALDYAKIAEITMAQVQE